MIKILFVCTGNICRSPTAEAIAKKYLADTNLSTQVFTSSAGLQGHHVGEPPDTRTINAGKSRGYTFDMKAQLFPLSAFFEFDWIIAMDKSHYERLQVLKPKTKIRARMVEIIHYCQINEKKLLPGIPDPYYGIEKDFELVIDLLEVGIKNFFQKEIHGQF